MPYLHDSKSEITLRQASFLHHRLSQPSNTTQGQSLDFRLFHRLQSFTNLAGQFNENQRTTKHQRRSAPMVECEGVLEVKDRKYQTRELSQRDHQRDSQRGAL